MKVGELKRLLELMETPDDLEVVVAISSPGTIGATPSVCVDKVAKGFDWNTGRLFLYPAESLMKTNKEKKK
jgi:hypothetical protein